MLVLSRTRGEQIIIDGRITVTVVDIRGDKVRIGIEGPRDVPVHRREVFDAIKRQGARDSVLGAREAGAPAPAGRPAAADGNAAQGPRDGAQ